jgi:hypothetical protein
MDLYSNWDSSVAQSFYRTSALGCEPVNKNYNNRIHITTRILGTLFVWAYVDSICVHCDFESITDLAWIVLCHVLTPWFQKPDTILTAFHVHPGSTKNDKQIRPAVLHRPLTQNVTKTQ